MTIQSKEETSSLFPSSHLSLPQFSSFFDFCNIFLLLLFGPQFHFYSQFNLSKSYFGHMNLLNYDHWVMNW